MPKKKTEEPFDPENLKPEDKLKFEIATELGLGDKVIAGGWRCPVSYTHLTLPTTPYV